MHETKIEDLLTPKGAACIFWLYRNFGQVRVTGEFHILG